MPFRQTIGSLRLVVVPWEFIRESVNASRAIEVGSVVFSLSLSPDGNKLACGTEKDIRIYDVKTGALVPNPFFTIDGYKALRQYIGTSMHHCPSFLLVSIRQVNDCESVDRRLAMA